MKVRFAGSFSWLQSIAGATLLISGLITGRSPVYTFIGGPLFLITGLISFSVPYLEVKDERLNVWQNFLNQKSFSLHDLDVSENGKHLSAWTGRRWKKIAWRMSANREEWDTFLKEYEIGKEVSGTQKGELERS